MIYRFLSLVKLILLLALINAGCDSSVYLSEELSAKKRFLSISVGMTEADLQDSLGPPLGLVQVQPTGIIVYTSLAEGNPIELSLADSSRNSWPEEIRFLPVKSKYTRVFVYIETTVYAYFYIGESGKIESVEVVNS